MSLTVSQAARRTPFSEATLRGMIRRGEIVPIRVGSRVMLPDSQKLGILFRQAGQ